jgi:Xanthomonas XOO_2897-like deaminase
VPEPAGRQSPFTDTQRACREDQRGLPSGGPGDPALRRGVTSPGLRIEPVGIREAATNLGAVWLALGKDVRDLDDLLPTTTGPLRDRLAGYRLQNATAKVFGRELDTWVRIRKYDGYYDVLVPQLEKAARAWATRTLPSQARVLEALSREVADSMFQEWMHQAADQIAKSSGDCVGAAVGPLLKSPPRDVAQRIGWQRDVAKAFETGKQLCIRKASVSFENETPRGVLAEIEYAGAQGNFAKAVTLHKKYVEAIRILRSARQFPDLVLAYARSAKEGTVQTRELIGRAVEGVREFSEDLTEHPAHVWRYPVLVAQGLQELGLRDVPGLEPYALAVANLKASKRPEDLFSYLGMGLLFIGMLGGVTPGLLVLDAVLGGASAFLTFLREGDQRQAAEASLLLPDQAKFVAEFNGYGETQLALGFALFAGYAAVRGIMATRKAPPFVPQPTKPGGARQLQPSDPVSWPAGFNPPPGLKNVTLEELLEFANLPPGKQVALAQLFNEANVDAAVRNRAAQVLAAKSAEYRGVPAVASYSTASSAFRIRDIPYGEGELSEFAQQVRVELNLRRGGNVAVFEFDEIPDGFRQMLDRARRAESLTKGGAQIRVRGNRVAFVNIAGVAHSEQWAHELIRQGRQANYRLAVRRVYSELNPCADRCLPLLREYYPDVEVTWSFPWDWDTDWPARDAAIAALFR